MDKDLSAQDQADIILGFNELDVNGETIKVSEFLFIQELKALTVAEPIIADIAQLYIDGGDPNLVTIEKVFAVHKDAMVELLIISTGKPLEWFNTLKGAAGRQLFLIFWGVNSHFFTQRIASLYMMARPEILKGKEQPSALETSSQH